MPTYDEVTDQAQYQRDQAGGAADMLDALAIKTRVQAGLTKVQMQLQAQYLRDISNGSADTLDYLAEEFLTTAPPPPPPPPDPSGESLIIRPGVVFAADSYIHTKLAPNALVDTNSAAMVADFVRQATDFVNGFGHVDINIQGGTPVLYIVGPDQPTVQVRYTTVGGDGGTLEAEQWAAVPLPDNFDAAGGTDMEAMVYQPSTDTIWEFWIMHKTGAQTVNSAGATVDEWGAEWGGRMQNVSTNPGQWLPDPNTGYHYGTTASSLPFLGLMMTVAEMRQSPPKIEHALGVAIMDIAAWDVISAPALRSDGNAGGPIPMGACFRFPASLDLASFGLDPFAYAIAKAIQDYGMYVWDTSGVVGFRAENPTGHYPDGDPWWKEGGILGCPAPTESSWEQCWAPHHFASGQGMPWHLLQVLKLRLG